MDFKPGALSMIENGSPRATQAESSGYDVLALVKAMRRNLPRLAAWLVLCVAAASAYVALTPPEFSAATDIILEPAHTQRSPLDATIPQAPLDAAQADSRIQVIKSERVLRLVFETRKLGEKVLDAPPKRSWLPAIVARLLSARSLSAEERVNRAFVDFMNHVSVRRLGLSYVIETTFRAETGREAAQIANAITAAYLRDLVLSGRRGEEMLQSRVDAVGVEEKALLEAVQTGVLPRVDFADADARVISAAIEPLSKATPQTSLVVAFSITFGLLTGLAVIVLRHNTDPMIRSPRQIMRKLGVPCLGSIPATPIGAKRPVPRGRRSRQTLAAADIASLRPVLSRVFFDAARNRHPAVGVVALSKGEGVSTTALNLSTLLGGSKRGVTLIDANAEDPGLSNLLLSNEAAGLAQAIAEHDPALHMPHYELASGARFLPRGFVQDDGGSLFLGTREMKLILDTLLEAGPVILDLPALQTSAEAQAIGPLLDGIILIVTAGSTFVDEAIEALHSLEAAKVRVLGVIFNRSGPRRAPRRPMVAAAYDASRGFDRRSIDAPAE